MTQVSEGSSVKAEQREEVMGDAVARRELIAKTICRSGRFETGEGTCAVACLDHLGFARRNCGHASRIHGALAQQIDEALSKATQKGEG